MVKTYITFGQIHKHEINGKIFDKDCIAVIESESQIRGREMAFELFGTKWAFEYSEETMSEKIIKYFPRGFVYVS